MIEFGQALTADGDGVWVYFGAHRRAVDSMQLSADEEVLVCRCPNDSLELQIDVSTIVAVEQIELP